MRIITPLNFNWLFSKKENSLDRKNMELVDIPHNNVKTTLNNFNETVYQFESVYIKEVNIVKDEKKLYFIQFDGVLHEAEVYVNNKLVGTNTGGYNSFKFDITNEVINGLNEIKVNVDSRETINTPPFGKTMDYLTFGGIYREVSLIETGKTIIESIDIKTSDLLTNPKISIKVNTNELTDVLIELLDNNKVLTSKMVKSDTSYDFNYNVTLWDIDNPKLYDIRATILNNDQLVITTGFKDSNFKKDGFYLNGKLVKIVGLNRHQIYPYVGYAMPKSGQELDARMLKKTGNAVRTSHYPQSHHFINECDRLGIMVFTEAPGWQSMGDQKWQDDYFKQVQLMVNQYKHHPSIIMWGTRVNESGDNNDLYTKTNEYARKVTPNIQTGGVRDFSYSELLEDVYTYNDFFHNGTNNYTKDLDEIVEGEPPYMVTEFNGHMFPTKSFDNSIRQLEHATRYAHILNAHMGSRRTSGSFGWSFVDYYTHKEFGSGDNVCYHGVYDMFRIAKPAAKVYESQFANDIYLEPLNINNLGDYNAGHIDAFYIASNCDYIEVYRNDEYLDKVYPNKELFGNLKYPLFVIDDLYGDAYSKRGYSLEEAKELKEIATDVARRGGPSKITKHDTFEMSKFKVAWDIYGKEVANWGSDTFTYKFVGVLGDKRVERTMGPSNSYSYEITADSNTLYHLDTYDVTRVVITAKDNLGNIKIFSNDSFKVETTDNVELIGESFISLIGGKRAFWVKSKKLGSGKIIIKNDHITKEIKIEVK